MNTNFNNTPKSGFINLIINGQKVRHLIRMTKKGKENVKEYVHYMTGQTTQTKNCEGWSLS